MAHPLPQSRRFLIVAFSSTGWSERSYRKCVSLSQRLLQEQEEEEE